MTTAQERVGPRGNPRRGHSPRPRCRSLRLRRCCCRRCRPRAQRRPPRRTREACQLSCCWRRREPGAGSPSRARGRVLGTTRRRRVRDGQPSQWTSGGSQEDSTQRRPRPHSPERLRRSLRESAGSARRGRVPHSCLQSRREGGTTRPPSRCESEETQANRGPLTRRCPRNALQRPQATCRRVHERKSRRRWRDRAPTWLCEGSVRPWMQRQRGSAQTAAGR